ncbi:MAG: hexitol phosphatase HxpB [Bacteroidetes bacterium]|nr:hexitol phosphatase HxpB [Bacteroidota bacterium]
MNTVIFDMDGLLIDSEPIWQEATSEIFATKNLHITLEQYESTTGLRTAEFLEHWFDYFQLDKALLFQWQSALYELVIAKVKSKGQVMQGVDYIFDLFAKQNFKMGVASSSPMILIDCVIDMLGVRQQLQAITSAEDLPFGKPNPQVYINCANELNSKANDCICFEDSINGMIAAKAAKMKCVVVPAPSQFDDLRWHLSDLKIKSLLDFKTIPS